MISSHVSSNKKIIEDNNEEYFPNYFIWKVIIKQMATLSEIEKFWSIDDLLDAHIIMSSQEEAEINQMINAKKGN
jgi:hypothetical protein